MLTWGDTVTIQDFKLLKSKRDSAVEIEGVISSYEEKYRACQELIKRNEREISGMQKKMENSKKDVEKHRRAYSKEKKKYNDAVKELDEIIAEGEEQTKPIELAMRSTLKWSWGVGIPLFLIETFIFGADPDNGTFGGGIASLGCCLSMIMFIMVLDKTPSTEIIEKRERITRSDSWERRGLKQTESEFKRKQSEFNKTKREISKLEKTINEAKLEMEACLNEIKKHNESLLIIWKSVEHLIP